MAHQIRIPGYKIKNGKVAKRPPRAVSARIAIAKSKKVKPARKGHAR